MNEGDDITRSRRSPEYDFGIARLAKENQCLTTHSFIAGRESSRFKSAGNRYSRDKVHARSIANCITHALEHVVTTTELPDAARRPTSGAGRCRPSAAPRVRSVNGPQDSGQPR